MNIKKIRILNNLTQSEFAEKLKVSKSTVESWEQGKRNIPDAMQLLIKSIFKMDDK